MFSGNPVELGNKFIIKLDKYLASGHDHMVSHMVRGLGRWDIHHGFESRTQKHRGCSLQQADVNLPQ